MLIQDAAAFDCDQSKIASKDDKEKSISVRQLLTASQQLVNTMSRVAQGVTEEKKESLDKSNEQLMLQESFEEIPVGATVEIPTKL